jgi:hypothetical protein
VVFTIFGHGILPKVASKTPSEKNISRTFLLLAASSACFTKAIPSEVTCCSKIYIQYNLSHKYNSSKEPAFDLVAKDNTIRVEGYGFKTRMGPL